jgi:hypothetical protein
MYWHNYTTCSRQPTHCDRTSYCASIHFLGAFAKLRKASICPSVHMEQLGSHGLHEILYLSIFRKYVENIEVPLKSDKNNSTSHASDRYMYIFNHISLISSHNKICSDESCRESQNTHFMLTLWRRIFFLILAHPVYKMWIIQEPKKVALWNKRHFEEEKTENVQHV